MKDFQKTVDTIKHDFGNGLLSADIWDKTTGLSMANYNSNTKATVLFDKIVKGFEGSLIDLGFPGINKYIMTDIDDTTVLLIIKLDDRYFASIIFDKTLTSLGVVFSLVIPNTIKSFR